MNRLLVFFQDQFLRPLMRLRRNRMRHIEVLVGRLARTFTAWERNETVRRIFFRGADRDPTDHKCPIDKEIGEPQQIWVLLVLVQPDFGVERRVSDRLRQSVRLRHCGVSFSGHFTVLLAFYMGRWIPPSPVGPPGLAARSSR